MLRASRRDELGVNTKYLLAFSGGNKLSAADVAGLRHTASFHSAALVVICDVCEDELNDLPVIAPEDFIQRLGGAISSYLPLESFYNEHLVALAHNKLPEGVEGRADDLFEEYVHVGLQFILHKQVVRYGQDRRFKTLPDGVVLGGGSLLLLYDCKAAKDGYDISRNSIRQFADYVRRFHQNYERYIGRVHCFLVVSSFFQSPETLDERSRDLLAECQVPLASLNADEMGQIVQMFVERPAYRQSIEWKRILSGGAVHAAGVQKDLQERIKDGVIRT